MFDLKRVPLPASLTVGGFVQENKVYEVRIVEDEIFLCVKN
jgi:hypothetical protein